MGPDFRTEPMESREGAGIAKAAWEKVPGKGKLHTPYSIPMIGAIARTRIEELIGFWVLWHMRGGFDGLEKWGMNRATIYRKVARFRETFGAHPDVFQLPGVSLDVIKYYEEPSKKPKKAKPHKQ